MHRFSLLLAPLLLGGCDMMLGGETCGPGAFTSYFSGTTCSASVEDTLHEIHQSKKMPVQFQPSLPIGDHYGTVTALDSKRIEIDFGETSGELRWPNALPFTIEPGEEMVLQVDQESTTLFFEQGALAFHAGSGEAPPTSEGLRLGSREVRWETGCSSSLGTSLSLVVGEKLVPAGSAAEQWGWRVRNLGAFSQEGCAPLEDFYLGAWIAESTEIRYQCVGPPSPKEACSEEIRAANETGKQHDFGVGALREGSYLVELRESDGFIFRDQKNQSIHKLQWPEALPVEFAEGDELTVALHNGWNVFRFPRGALAFALSRDFFFEPPLLSPDRKAYLRTVTGCALGERLRAPGVSFSGGNDFILPGEEIEHGEWTYRLLFAWEAANVSCSKGSVSLGEYEGRGEGAIIAHQILAHARKD